MTAITRIKRILSGLRIFKRLRALEKALADLSSVVDSRSSDILLAMATRFEQPQVRLLTDHPVAIASHDHQFPRGTANDNTRYPRLCYKLEQIFPGQKLKVLDLGCAGGGIVYNFLQRGHFAMGLEGSDYSLKFQRAQWPIIPHHLKTCDITKPFKLEDLNSKPMQFDVITAWEVLEHIPEESLRQLLKNIRQHLRPGGLFLASVAQFPDTDPVTKAVWHVTIKGREWWENLVKECGFGLGPNNVFEILDFPRGSGNGPDDWSVIRDPSMGFHMVVHKENDELNAPKGSTELNLTAR